MKDELERETEVHAELQGMLGMSLQPPKVPFWTEFAYRVLTDSDLTPKLTHSSNRIVAPLYQQCKSANPPTKEEWQQMFESPKLVDEVYSALALSWITPMLPGDTGQAASAAMQLWYSVMSRQNMEPLRDLYRMVNRIPQPSISVEL